MLGVFTLQYWNTSSDALQLNSSKDSIPDIPLERTWTTEPLAEASLHSGLKDSLYRAMIIESFEDTLYIVDYGDMIIKRFTSEGNFIDKIGKGVGRGPGEFSGIVDLYKFSDTLYVLDKDNHVSLIDINSKRHLTDFKTNIFPGEVLVFSNHIVVKSMLDYKFFTVYDKSGSVVTYFGGLAEGKQKEMMSYGGYLVPSDKPNEFNFVTIFGSYLNYYNIDGDSVKTVRTIDRMEIPPPQHLSTGIRVPKSPIITEDATYNDKFLFLQYSRAAQKNITREEFKEIHSFVDIYTLNGDEYKGSFMLPSWTNGISIIDNTIYTIRDSDRSIQAFELPKFN